MKKKNPKRNHQHHDMQIRHLVNAGFTENDDGAGGVQASPACSARHLNVFTCGHESTINIRLFSPVSSSRIKEHNQRWLKRKEHIKRRQASPGSRFLNPVPSCFLMLSNTTVLAGMFTPIANVSVANST